MRKILSEKRFEISMFTIGILLGFLLNITSIVNAVSFSTVNPPILTGDINGTQILDGTITNDDINANGAIDATKIRGGLPTGLVMFSNGNRLATSSKFYFSTSTDTLINTASTTLGATTTINGVAYGWPSSQGAANTALQNDGSGYLSWAPSSASYLSTTFTTDEALVAGNAVTIADGLQRVEVFAPPMFPTSGITGFGKLTPHIKVAVSTTETTARTVSGIRVHMAKFGSPTDNSTISIQTDNSNAPSGTPVASYTLDNATLTTIETPYDFYFATTTLTASVRYWIVFERSGATDASNYPMVGYNSPAVYAGGAGSYWDTSSWSAPGGTQYSFALITNSTPGRVVKSSASMAANANSFVGFSSGTSATGTSATINIAGAATGFSGLSIGKQYYLANATSSIGTSAGTVSRKVCLSLTSTSCLITNIW